MRLSYSRLLTICGWMILFQGSATKAQSVAQQVIEDFREVGKDAFAVWTSPLRATQRDWLIAGGTVGLAALVSLVDDDFDRLAVRNSNASQLGFLKPVRRGGLVYGGNKIVPYAAGAYIAAVATNNREVRDGIIGCLGSYGAASLARTQVFYRLIARDRPDTARRPQAGDPRPAAAERGDQYSFEFPGSSEWGKHSFPGGHVANVLSCVTFLNQRFNFGYAEPVLYAIAGGVGVGRILDRGHWASDQLVGMVFGYAVGRAVARRSLARKHDRAGSAGEGLGLSRTREGVTVTWTVVF